MISLYNKFITYKRRSLYYGIKLLPPGSAIRGLVSPIVTRNKIFNKLPFHPNIAFIGTDYNQDGTGFLQSLSAVSNLKYFVQSNGKYGQYDAHNGGRFCGWKLNDFEIRKWLTQLSLLENWKPDIILMQAWNESVNWRTWEWCRSTFKSVLVNIGLDDRHACLIGNMPNGWRGTLGLAGIIDIHLTTAQEMVQIFSQFGCKTLYWPEASDPQFFYPINDTLRDIDVLFVGRPYGMRNTYLTYLRNNGINVSVYGKETQLGILPTHEVNYTFNRSKIVLGFSNILESMNWSALKLRDFDAPMSGAVYLTSWNDDLNSLYEIGHEIDMYHSQNDLLSKIREYLANENKSKLMRQKARKSALSRHTWTYRFNELFNFINMNSG